MNHENIYHEITKPRRHEIEIRNYNFISSFRAFVSIFMNHGIIDHEITKPIKHEKENYAFSLFPFRAFVFAFSAFVVVFSASVVKT